MRAQGASIGVSRFVEVSHRKTTLARALVQTGMEDAFEDYESNPFWSAFYDNPTANAFEAEISFLLQHYHQIKMAGQSFDSVLVCDYSLLLDRAYGATTLEMDELAVFLSVYNLVTKRVPSPILIVHLRCDADEEFSRIARRGRQVERTATLDLLLRLNAAVEQQLAAPGLEVPIIRIDSDRFDFRDEGADRERVVAAVRGALSRATATREGSGHTP